MYELAPVDLAVFKCYVRAWVESGYAVNGRDTINNNLYDYRTMMNWYYNDEFNINLSLIFLRRK